MIARETCTTVHISEPPPSSGKSKKRGTAAASEQSEVYHFFESLHDPKVGGERGQSTPKAKKD